MDVAEIISIILILLLVILSLKNLTYGFCEFLVVRILIPESVRFPFGDLSLNTGMIVTLLLLTLISSCINGRKLRCNKNFINGLLMLIISIITLLLLSDYGNLSYQIGYMIQFIITDIMPFVLAAFIIREKKDALIVINAFLTAICFICVYGIISYFLGRNPYLLFFSGNDWNVHEYWYGNFTTATFVSTNAFGYFISLSVPFISFLVNRNVFSNKSKVALVLLLINAILCKKRTTIVVLLLFAVMWFISGNFKKRIKYVMYSIPLIVISLVFIFVNPSLSVLKNFIITSVFFWNDSIFNSVTTVSGGSSMSLRLAQMLYPYTEIKSNLLFGHGFGWCSWFLSKGSIHPVLFGFESLFSQAICEFGLMAFIIYPVVFRILYTFIQNRQKDKYILLFIISSTVLMIGTGAIYWYLELVMLLLMKVLCQNNIKDEKFYGKKSVNNITSLQYGQCTKQYC